MHLLFMAVKTVGLHLENMLLKHFIKMLHVNKCYVQVLDCSTFIIMVLFILERLSKCVKCQMLFKYNKVKKNPEEEVKKN